MRLSDLRWIEYMQRVFPPEPRPMHPPYSRQSPSPRFAELTRLYAEMHRDGDRAHGISAAKTFSGISLLPVAPQIKRAVDATGARSLLDYGCGKATQYNQAYSDPEQRGFPSVVAYWGVENVHCYDPVSYTHLTLPTIYSV